MCESQISNDQTLSNWFVVGWHATTKMTAVAVGRVLHILAAGVFMLAVDTVICKSIWILGKLEKCCAMHGSNYSKISLISTTFTYKMFAKVDKCVLRNFPFSSFTFFECNPINFALDIMRDYLYPYNYLWLYVHVLFCTPLVHQVLVAVCFMRNYTIKIQLMFWHAIWYDDALAWWRWLHYLYMYIRCNVMLTTECCTLMNIYNINHCHLWWLRHSVRRAMGREAVVRHDIPTSAVSYDLTMGKMVVMKIASACFGNYEILRMCRSFELAEVFNWIGVLMWPLRLQIA